MPKLYLKDYLPSAISAKLAALTPFYNSRKSKKYLYTSSGVMLLRNNKIFQLNPVDIAVEDVGDGGDGGDDGTGCGGEYILDTSYMEEEEVLSQIPIKHVYSEVHELHFCVGKQSTIHFVVEGTYPHGVERTGTVDTELTDNLYTDFIPHDMYFTTKDNMDNKLLLREINMMLSIII
jgi:hypothetical protein